jgi:hypothetical protein
MGNPKNFATQILGKSSSSRSLTDPAPEPELEQEEMPAPQIMIDTLYRVLMTRLDAIEKKIDELNG